MTDEHSHRMSVDSATQGRSGRLLPVSIGAWLLFAFGRANAAGAASGSAPRLVGAYIGTLLTTLLLVLVARSIVRLLRRRPVRAPLWTPALFFTAAGLSFLLLMQALGGQSSS